MALNTASICYQKSLKSRHDEPPNNVGDVNNKTSKTEGNKEEPSLQKELRDDETKPSQTESGKKQEGEPATIIPSHASDNVPNQDSVPEVRRRSVLESVAGLLHLNGDTLRKCSIPHLSLDLGRRRDSLTDAIENFGVEEDSPPTSPPTSTPTGVKAYYVPSRDKNKNSTDNQGVLTIGMVYGENDEKGKDPSALNDVNKWENLKIGLHNLSRPVMRKHNPLSSDPSNLEKLKYFCTCPPHGKIGDWMTYLLLFILFYGSLVYITFDSALPGGNLFSLTVLIIVAHFGGVLFSALHLPSLLGMLLVGIMFRSVPGLHTIGNNIHPDWSSCLRSMALVVILIRAGLGLDPDALKKLSLVVLRLAVIPCLVEAGTVAVVSHFLLEFPWKWGFLLGFVLAAISPAVVVHCLLRLNAKGYGKESGISTLIIAAASIDDVLAISGFGVCLGMIFSEGSAVWQGFKGPLEFLIGITFGIIMGVILWVLPNKEDNNAVSYRFMLLFGSGMLAIFGSRGIDFSGAGALGCLCVAFVAGCGWRRQAQASGKKMEVNEYFNYIWMFFQPMLFGLIGTEIRVSELEVSTVGWGIITLFVGLVLRVGVSFAIMGNDMDIKERIFVALAWLPKATVQAAIGPTAYDYARRENRNPLVETIDENLGMKVLTIAVLVILITAPIGAIAINLSAPRLLKRTPTKEEQNPS